MAQKPGGGGIWDWLLGLFTSEGGSGSSTGSVDNSGNDKSTDRSTTKSIELEKVTVTGKREWQPNVTTCFGQSCAAFLSTAGAIAGGTIAAGGVAGCTVGTAGACIVAAGPAVVGGAVAGARTGRMVGTVVDLVVAAIGDGNDGSLNVDASKDVKPEDEAKPDTKDNTTETTQGKGRAPKEGKPDSIYEQVDDKGNVKSRTFYDENGRSFSRQDFDHEHGGMQPHEHQRQFDKSGRPITCETVIVPIGYSCP